MKYIVVAFVLVVVACAQPIQRRCTRSLSRWNGAYREVNYDANPGEIAYRFANISYDYNGKRIRVHEFEDRNGERPERIDKLYLYNEQTEYRVERGQCEKRDISERPFDHFGVLDGATFFGVDYLGAELSGLGMKVDQFGMELNNSGRYYASYAPLGSIDYECIPVLEAYINLRSPYQDERYNVHYEFLNVTSFVPSDAFEIPSACLTLPRQL